MSETAPLAKRGLFALWWSAMDASLITSTVEGLLKALGADFTDISVTGGSRTVVNVTANDSKNLIGPRGEHLQALNAIARRLVEQRNAESANFLIDVNGYHEERLKRLREGALMLAQRARLFKHEVEMDPMSSYERLVVHELFAEDPEITTESRGEGKTRHIVLKYKGAAAL